MARRLTVPGLAWRLAIRERARSAVLLSVAVITAAIAAGLLTAHSSAARAIEASVHAELAGHSYVVQPATAEALAALLEVEAAGAMGMFETSLARSGRLVNAVVHVSNDSSLAWGIVREGGRPAPGQVAVFDITARALGAVVGESIDVDGQALTVSGILVDPADADRGGALLVDPQHGDFTSFLTDASIFDSAALRPFFDEQLIQLRGRESVTASLAANVPQAAQALPAIAGSVGLAGLVLAAVVLATVLQSRRPARIALQAGGLAPRRGWLVIGLGAALPLAVGTVLGLFLAWGLMWWLRTPISGLLGQTWQQVTPRLTEVLVAGGIMAIAVSLVGEGLRWAASVQVRVHRARLAVPKVRWVIGGAAAVGCALLGVGAASQAGLLPIRQGLVMCGLWGALLLAALLPSLVGFVFDPGRHPGSAALVRGVRGPQQIAASLAVVVAMLAGWHAGFTAHNTEIQESWSAVEMPPGTLVADWVSASVMDQLVTSYRALGGDQTLRFKLTGEGTAGAVRVVSPGLRRCLAEDGGALEELPDECWSTDAPRVMGTVALTESAGTVSADPYLIEEGHVGLLDVTPESAFVPLYDVEVIPDPLLGGLVPGLVVPEDSTLAIELGLEPSGFELLALLDFGLLSVENQAHVRALLVSLAGGAHTFEDTGNRLYDVERRLAVAVAVAAAILVAAIMLVAAASTSVAHIRTRRTLLHLNGDVRQRAAIAWGVFGPTALALSLAPVLLWICLRITAIPYPGGYGPVWFVPCVAGVFATGVGGVLWHRAPSVSAAD